LGDEFFLRPLVNELILMDRNKDAEDLEAASLSPTYVFVGNDAIRNVDGLGLKPPPSQPTSVTIPDCNIIIFAGHGLSDNWFVDDGKGGKEWADPSAANRVDALSRVQVPSSVRGDPAVSATAIIACNARWFARVTTHLVQDLPTAEFKFGAAGALFDSAIENARSYAKDTICKSCKCKSVTIKVDCRDPFYAPGKTKGVSQSQCGFNEVVTCPGK
jgi:hypothetical protein